jgi:hypothetical protein
VQVIENRSELDALVLDIRADAGRPGYRVAELDVSVVRSVEAFPNLLAELAGKRVDVVISDVDAHSLARGSRVTLRARRAGPMLVFAERLPPSPDQSK